MGEKYRAQIKRWRTKTRSTPEGMLYHRMSQSVEALCEARNENANGRGYLDTPWKS